MEEEQGGSPWEVLYDDIVNPVASQRSKEASGAFLPFKKNFPFGFSGIDNCWEMTG